MRADYTLRWEGKLYQIERQAIVGGLRGAQVRVEKRLDGELAVRHGERYLPVHECAPVTKTKTVPAAKPAGKRRGGRYHDWNKTLDLKNSPPVWRAERYGTNRPEEPF